MKKGTGIPSYTQKTKETVQPRKYNFRNRDLRLPEEKEKALTQLEKARRLQQNQSSYSETNILGGDPYMRPGQPYYVNQPFVNQSYDNQPYYTNNINSSQINEGGYSEFNNMMEMDDAFNLSTLDDSSSFTNEVEYDEDEEFNVDATFGGFPGKAPKQTLMIKNAKIKGYFGDKNTFQKITKDASTVVNKSLLVSTFLFNFADDIFIKVVRPTNYLQCNQSVFNYPISETRKNFTVEKVEANIVKLNNQALDYKKHILNSLSHKDSGYESKTRTYNVPEDVVEETLRFAARGAAYLNKVYTKAALLLKKLVDKAGNTSYQSLEHHLYEGDYSDLFAFNVLRYLYKIDSEKDIRITKDKDLGKQLKTGDTKILYRKTKTKGKKQVEAVPGVEYYGKNSNNPTKEYKIDDKTALNAFKDTEGIKDLEEDDMKTLESGARSNNSRAKKPKQIKKKSKQSYDKYEVFLKPTRGTKILLFTEPNVFLYQMNYAVAKGLSILMKVGVVPEKIITNLKICSVYTGAIYKLSATKNSLKVSPDTSCKSYSIMKQPSWTQCSVILDIFPFINQSDEISKAINMYISKYPEAVFKTEKYEFSGERHLSGMLKNCKKLLEAAWLDEVLKTYSDQLDAITKLGCNTPSTFAKVSSIKKMKLYNKDATVKEYENAVKNSTLKDTEITPMNPKPKLQTFEYGQFGLTDDVSITYYKEGINHTNKTLVFNTDEYIEAATKDLYKHKKLQIPLLYRSDDINRTRKFLGKKDLYSSEGTIAHDLEYVYDRTNCPFPENTQFPTFEQRVSDLVANNTDNLASYILSTFVKQFESYYKTNRFNTNKNTYLTDLTSFDITGINNATNCLIEAIDNGEIEIDKNKNVNFAEVLGSLFRYIFGDRKLTESDKTKANQETLTEWFKDILSNPTLAASITTSEEDTVLGDLIECLVNQVNKNPKRVTIKIKDD